MFGQFEMTCTTMYILLGYGVFRTFNYISLILLEETGVPEENHQPAAQGEYSYLTKKPDIVCYLFVILRQKFKFISKSLG